MQQQPLLLFQSMQKSKLVAQNVCVLPLATAAAAATNVMSKQNATSNQQTNERRNERNIESEWGMVYNEFSFSLSSNAITFQWNRMDPHKHLEIHNICETVFVFEMLSQNDH